MIYTHSFCLQKAHRGVDSDIRPLFLETGEGKSRKRVIRLFSHLNLITALSVICFYVRVKKKKRVQIAASAKVTRSPLPPPSPLHRTHPPNPPYTLLLPFTIHWLKGP